MYRRYQLRHDGHEIDVTGPSFVIGRETDCQFVLKHGLASRHHAKFSEVPDGLVVEDLGSLNGVFVNQRRIVEPTVLAHGDVVAIGLDSFEVMDVHVVPRAKRSTIPLPPYARADVDGPEPVTVAPQLGVLTDREREVFELIVLGFTQKEIGAKLFVSIKTVETHRAHIADKLSCRSRAELVAFAITAGMLRKGA